MILVDLLVILLIGVILFLFASHLETVKQNASHHRPAHFYRSRHSVESALDGVLSRYNQGFLSEKQYGDQSDALIDQLADILHEEAV